MVTTTTRDKADFNPATHETRIAALEKDGGGGAIQVPIDALLDGTGINTPIVEVANTPLGLSWERSRLYVPSSAVVYIVTIGAYRQKFFGFSIGNDVGSVNQNAWGSDANDTLNEISCRYDLPSAAFSVYSGKQSKWNASDFIWIKALDADLPNAKLTYQSDAWGQQIYGLPMADELSQQWGAYFKANVNKTITVSISVDEPAIGQLTETLRVKTSNIAGDFALEVSSNGINHRGKKVLLEGDAVGVADSIVNGDNIVKALPDKTTFSKLIEAPNITKMEIQLDETTNLLADERRKVKALQGQLNVINSRLGIA